MQTHTFTIVRRTRGNSHVLDLTEEIQAEISRPLGAGDIADRSRTCPRTGGAPRCVVHVG